MSESFSYKDLVDVRTVKIDENLPNDEWYLELVRQIKNPFFYKYGKHFVELNYDGCLPPPFELIQRMVKGEEFVQIAAEYIKRMNSKGKSKDKNMGKEERPEIEKINTDDLVDVSTVRIDDNLPAEERYLEFVRQIKNPFYYMYGSYIIQLNYGECLPPFIDLILRMVKGEEFVQIAAYYIKHYVKYLDSQNKSKIESMREEETFISEMINVYYLEEICAVNKDENLLPHRKHLIEYVRKIKNSEPFKYGKYNVTLRYGGPTLFYKNVWQI